MSARTASRLIRPSAIHRFHVIAPRRQFITLPGTEATSLTESRILPYSSDSIYTIIADVDNYSNFLPYCRESKVTQWSSKDSTGKEWPSEAILRIGWGGIEESFTSRLFCLPGRELEALGGEAQTTLTKSELQHHSATLGIPAKANEIFKSISTKWTVKPFHYKPPSGQPQTDNATHPPRDQTEVNLSIDFQFSNPLYAALSKAVAPKVAGIMIEAFEKRARLLLDGPGRTIP